MPKDELAGWWLGLTWLVNDPWTIIRAIPGESHYISNYPLHLHYIISQKHIVKINSRPHKPALQETENVSLSYTYALELILIRTAIHGS